MANLIEILVSPGVPEYRERIREPVLGFTRGHGGLPAPVTRLIGREREVAAIVSLVTEGISRLVVLTGPGGVGKTRLAAEVGWRAMPVFEFVGYTPIAAVATPEGVVPAICAALSLGVESGQAWLRPCR